MTETQINELCRKAAKHLGIDWNSFEIEKIWPTSIVIKLDSDKSLYRVSDKAVERLNTV